MEPFVELNLCVEGAKEDGFHVSDLVWGKVKSYPWWPGQIVEPSTASAKAKEKKDSYLIAYFGDESVVWTEAAKIKPFEMHFSQMSKESSDEAFCQVVDAALEEYSRRIQVGLACSCLPEDALEKVKLQVQGLPTHLSSIGSFTTAFQPEEIMTCLQTLGKSPQAACDALKFVTTKAHLSSFYRRRGYNELPSMEDFDLGEDYDLGDDTGLYAFQNGHKESEVKVDSQKEPACFVGNADPLGEAKIPEETVKEIKGVESVSVYAEETVEPVRRGRGRPKKIAVMVSESGLCAFQNGHKESEVKVDSQKEPACFVENADPLGEAKIPEETVKESKGAESVSVYAEETVKPVRRGRGRPKKTVVMVSESRVSSLTGQDFQECPPASEWLSKPCAAEELKLTQTRLEKRESEVIGKEACLEERMKELASLKKSLEKQETEHRSRGSLLQKKESELIAKENTLESLEKRMEPVQAFLDQKMKDIVFKEQHARAQLEERETFFQKRESELIEKEKTLEDRERSIESREERVERRENEVALKQMDLKTEENGLKALEEGLALKQDKFEKWEHDLNAKEIILTSRESELRDAQKSVEKGKKKVEAYTEKVRNLWLELNCNDESAFPNQSQVTEKGKRSREEMDENNPKTAVNKRMKLN